MSGTRKPTCYPLHPNGWEPAARVVVERETWAVPPEFRHKAIKAAHSDVGHAVWRWHEDVGVTLCGRKIGPAVSWHASGVTCRSCRQRSVDSEA